MSERRFARLAAACFFATGATSLVYQVVWSRWLTLSFGAAHWSVATVVAAYMLGLGLGSWLLGRAADRARRPARLYAVLELLVAVYGALSPLVLAVIERAFVAYSRAADPGPVAATLARLLLALAALTVPTVLMGGTLPVLARALVAPAGRPPAADVGRLYALNTLGAVCGAALAGFVLIERLGLRPSLFAAAGLNAAAGLAILAARPGQAPTAPAEARPARVEILTGAAARFALAAAFLSGFASLADEVVWTRVLALLTGASTYAFTVILTSFLLGIGLGARWSARRPMASPALRLAWTSALAGAGATLLLVLFEPATRLLFAAGQNPLTGWKTAFVLRAAIAAAAVVPATFGFGAAFPALVALAARDPRRTGSHVGLLYAANTLGAILGSLLGGFVLLRVASSYGVLAAGVLTSTGIGLAALGFARREGAGPGRLLAPALALGAVASAVLALEPWPRHLLDSGPAVYARFPLKDRLDLESQLARGARQLAFFREGLAATVSVRDSGHSRFLRINGKTDASTTGDMATQIALGLVPSLVHPGPTSALVIGAGSGVTARVVLEDSGVEALDLVEIEPEVIAAGVWFEDWNHAVYRDPRVQIKLADGRNHLLATTRRYDIVVSEPSNPWMAGIANLFTADFYALVRARLAARGVFVQWLQRYDLTDPTFRRLLATFLSAFPQAQLWRSGPGDALLLGSADPLVFDRARVEAVLATHRRRAPGELELYLQIQDPLDFAALYLLGGEGLRSYAAGARPLRDDPPELEFAALREMYADREWQAGTTAALLDLKGALRQAAPPASPPWDERERAYLLGRVVLALSPEPGAAAALFEQSLRLGETAIAWRWLGDAQAARGEAERAALAWSRALALDPRDGRSAARLARAALRQADPARARELLSVAVAEPWEPETPFVEADLAVAEGRGEDAIRAMDRARELHRRLSADPAYFQRIAAVFRGAARDRDAAPAVVAEVERRIAAEPRVVEWRLLRADLARQAGDHAGVARNYAALRAEGYRSVELLFLEARALLALGRPDEARPLVATVARFAPWRVDLEAADAEALGPLPPSGGGALDLGR